MYKLHWAFAVLLLWASPAGADWLITLEGKLIETQGPWTIEGETLAYTDLDGQAQSLPLDEVDLEASEETTALKAGKPYVPGQHTEVRPSDPPADGPAKPTSKKNKKSKKAKIILYSDAFCPNCAPARELLRDLGVDYVEKDIARSRRAYKEYSKKAGRGGGVPIIDVDGTIIFRYNPRIVRQRIDEFLKKQAEAGGGD